MVLSSENATACQNTEQQLRAENLPIHALPCDVTDPLQLRELVASTLERFGRLDALVGAAGISPAPGPLAEVSEENWAQIMRVNLEAAWRLSSLCLPHIAAQGGGSVTFISSIAGVRGNKSLGVYGISKAGLAQLARNLAVEWGPLQVRVNCVAPGLIRTSFAQEMLERPEIMERRLSLTPLRRVGEPEEVAGVVLLLASQAGAFITGQNIVVDGGTTISDGN